MSLPRSVAENKNIHVHEKKFCIILMQIVKKGMQQKNLVKAQLQKIIVL